MTMDAPREASSSAIHFPIPLPEPVMRATLPASVWYGIVGIPGILNNPFELSRFGIAAGAMLSILLHLVMKVSKYVVSPLSRIWRACF